MDVTHPPTKSRVSTKMEQRAYSTHTQPLPKGFALRKPRTRQGSLIQRVPAGLMTGNAYALAFSSRRAILDFLPMDSLIIKPILEKLAFLTG